MSIWPQPVRSCRPPLVRTAAAWLCALLIAWIGLAGAGDLLHGELHHDAGTPDHECAITLFAHGTEIPTAAGVIDVSPLPRLMAQISIPDDCPHSTGDVPRQPGRDPPNC